MKNYGAQHEQDQARRHQLTLGALAEGTDGTPRTVIDIIEILERDGLVRRVPDPCLLLVRNFSSDQEGS